MVLWKGWIIGAEEDRLLLKTLGVTVTKEKREIDDKVEFDVEVTEEALNKLDPYWGRLVWALDKVRER